MQSSSLYVPQSTEQYHTDEGYDPIVEFLRADLTRARWMLQQHIPDHCGWCYHQGAYEQYRWPCQLFQCAHDAIASTPPPTRNLRYPTLKEVSGT
jgi:hypothetical protein